MISNQGQKERIKLFIKHLNISTKGFELSCGLSNGYISSIRKGIGYKAIEQITEKYTNLNPLWLLTGEGEMLKPMRVIDRFDQYMKHKGLTDDVVINNLGWSKSTILGFGTNSLDAVRKTSEDLNLVGVEHILRFYTDINPIWLKTGSGEMLQSASINTFTQKNDMQDVYKELFFDSSTKIDILQEKINNLNKQVGSLEGELKAAHEAIESLKKELSVPGLFRAAK